MTLTVTRLADRLGGTADTKTQFSTDYASRYVRFVDTTAQELRLRVYVTPAGGRLRLVSTAAEQVGDMLHAAELMQSDDGCGLGGAVAFHRSVKRPAAVGSRAKR